MAYRNPRRADGEAIRAEMRALQLRARPPYPALLLSLLAVTNTLSALLTLSVL
jgi:hypothetical protein